MDSDGILVEAAAAATTSAAAAGALDGGNYRYESDEGAARSRRPISTRTKRRRRSSNGRSLSPAAWTTSESLLRDARQLSRDTSLAYLLPALTAAHLQLPYWERRCAGFAAAAFFALIHHAFELEHGQMSPILNRIDIFFAVTAAAIEISAVPPTPLRAVGAAVAAGSWLYQKLGFVPGTPGQVYAHIGWHLVSSVVATVLMVTGLWYS